MTEGVMSPGVAAAVAQYEMGASWVPTKAIGELSGDDMLYRPASGRNHIYWLFGHIITAADIAPYVNGGERVINTRYIKLFDMGIPPSDDAAAYPSREEMLEMFEKAVAHSLEAIRSLKDEDLSKKPSESLPEPLRPYFTTRMDVVAGFATHMAYHAGQIKTLLKMLGK